MERRTFIHGVFERGQDFRNRLVFAFVTHGRMFTETVPDGRLIIDGIVDERNDELGARIRAGCRVVCRRTRCELKLNECDFVDSRDNA